MCLRERGSRTWWTQRGGAQEGKKIQVRAVMCRPDRVYLPPEMLIRGVCKLRGVEEEVVEPGSSLGACVGPFEDLSKG